MAFGNRRFTLAAAAILFGAQGASAQTAEHVAAVQGILEKSPVRAGQCAPVTEDFQGWQAALMQRCEYKNGDMTGVAYVLDVKPEVMAKWIETGCEAHMSGVAACFDRMLRCAVEKSNATFAIGGNVIAERKGALQNMFFRNGVAIGAPLSGKPGAAPVQEQEKLARTPESAVEAMLGGGAVAFWHTMPFQFAVKAIDLGVPAEMNTPDRRQKWLEVIRAEIQLALTKPNNRSPAG